MTDGAAGVIATGFGLSEFSFLEMMRQEDRQDDRQREKNRKKGGKEVERETER